LIAKGKDVIDLGVGDPDLPTPDFVIEALARAAHEPANHRYALDQGMPELRSAISAWYKKRFNVLLDPETEILPLIGSKEGIVHLPLALLNPGDVALVPDPCYPPYRSGTWFAGAEPFSLPLLEEKRFLPDLNGVPEDVLGRAKLLFLNYPNNPTAATASVDFFRGVVSFAEGRGIVVCHDAAYTEVSFDGERQPSFLEADGSRLCGVEFHSLSKTMNMTGWRVGFVSGNAEVIRHLAKLKANIDSGVFRAIQWAAVEALGRAEKETERLSAVYEKRRDLVIASFRSVGWRVTAPKATFYVWVSVPPGYTSQELCMKLLREANVVVIPGNGFGPNGEGYVRISLTTPEHRIAEAMERIRKIHN
jgi:LL-diaminopimelate aminotransferase